MIASLLFMSLLTISPSAQAPALPPDTNTAARVLDRMADALGGRERLERLNNVRTRVTIEAAGLKGSGESLRAADGRGRSAYDLAGVDGGTSVFDGTTAWRKDLNGNVRQLAGTDLEIEIGDAYVSSFAFLMPGRRPGKVELAGMDPSGAHYVVKLAPDGGRPVTLYVDATTFLVDRQDVKEEDGRVTSTTFEDWRVVDGVRYPFRSVQHSGPAGDTKYDVVVTTTDLATNVAVDDATFARPAAGAADFRFTVGSKATGIPIELNANHIFVQVRVNGSGPRWFLFDTGAEATAVDSAALDELGLHATGAVEARGNGEGTMTASFVKGVTLSVAGADVLDQTVFAVPLGTLAAFEGRRIDGIIGYDFTSRFVVEIDYANRRMSLYDPKTFAYAGKGERLPVTLLGKIPFVHATIEEPGQHPTDGIFLVDTGSRLALSLNAPFVRNTPWAASAAGRAIDAPYGIGVGGTSTTRVGRIGGLRLGSVTIERPVTGFSLDVAGSQASETTTGAIGGEILRRFDVIFDYSRGEMILEPNTSLGEPFEYDMLGAMLRTDDADGGSFVVFKIADRSAAAAAGLKEGDRITAIDGRAAAAYSLESLRSLFRTDGQPLTFRVRRGAETVDVKVTLKRIV